MDNKSKISVDPKKSRGQNFLKSKTVINEIVNAASEDCDAIIEIGPGTGALTSKLLTLGVPVFAFEIDQKLCELLRQNLGFNQNLYLENTDILLINLNSFINTNMARYHKINIVSNLPYYITTPILFKLVNLKQDRINKMILMMQKEVANKLLSFPNHREYNSLSVSVQFYCDCIYLMSVPPNAFWPQPKVDSTVLLLKFHNYYQLTDSTAFLKFVQKLFNNKRKTILNNLTSVLKNRITALAILKKLNILENLRPENLTIENFYQIYSEVTANEWN